VDIFSNGDEYAVFFLVELSQYDLVDGINLGCFGRNQGAYAAHIG